MPTDYYELLGVSRQASDDEIKKAYRRLARELHPDANPDDTVAHERFKEVSVAYETLRDPERRRRYDAFGPDAARVGAGQSDPFGFGGGGLGDIFEAFFGGAGGRGFSGRRGAEQGADLELALELDFEESIFGVRREIKLRVPVACDTCSGSGARPGTSATACSGCGGSGEVRHVRQSILGQMVTASPCTRCGGRGQLIADRCPDCRGEGRRTEDKTYDVDVPPGVEAGMQLRLSGRGAAGPRGGPNGDLYLQVRVRPHSRFRREGHNLVAEIHLTMTQAALGTSLEFETLDGTETLLIPPGTQTGRVFELRGRGVPGTRARGRGDLLVRVVVDTPTGLTKDQEELMRRLAELRGEQVAPSDTSFFSRIRSAFK